MPPIHPEHGEPQRFGKRELLVSKGWIQAVVLVVLFGFFVLGFLAYRTYSGEAPIPARVVEAGRGVLFTGEDILAVQQVFLRNGLMEYGSIFGHGAYLGPDFTADYLRRAATSVANSYPGRNTSEQARAQTALKFKTNRFDANTNTLVFTPAQSRAYTELVAYYGKFFSEPSTRFGLRPKAVSDPTEIKQLTAFFSWSAWAAAALRPGHNYSYTNNWPPEPLVNNGVTADMIAWSMLSLAALLGGIGVLFFAFGRWNFLGCHGRERNTLSFRAPGEVCFDAGTARHSLVFSGHGCSVLDSDVRRSRIPALPRGRNELLRVRSSANTPVQSGANLAYPAGDPLGRYFLPRGWNFPSSYAEWP